MKKHPTLFAVLVVFGFTMCTTEKKPNLNSDSAKTEEPIAVKTNNEEAQTAEEMETTEEAQKSTSHVDLVERNSTESIEPVEFEKIDVGSIPNFDSVSQILKSTKLKPICEAQNIDQLDIDLMFMKTAVLPFNQFKATKLSDGSGRAFIHLFPEKDLNSFYNKARTYLKTSHSEK